MSIIMSNSHLEAVCLVIGFVDRGVYAYFMTLKDHKDLPKVVHRCSAAGLEVWDTYSTILHHYHYHRF